MITKAKSMDSRRDTADQKEFGGRRAKTSIAGDETSQRTSQDNCDRLLTERLARETAARPVLHPAPEISDKTLLDNGRCSSRMRNVKNSPGWTAVGEIREPSVSTLLASPYLAKAFFVHFRETLGQPSMAGVRPKVDK